MSGQWSSVSHDNLGGWAVAKRYNRRKMKRKEKPGQNYEKK
jgi:hypothetical protein